MIRIKPLELPKIPPDGGTITSISFQKQDPNRCSLFLNDAYAFGLHVDIVMQRDLKKGLFLSEARCTELTDEDLYFKALKRCLDFISYRQRASREVEQRLQQLGVSGEVADKVRQKLQDLGLVDDAEFARMYVESRIRSKGFGWMRIKQDLMQKGILASLAEDALKKAYPDEDQLVQLQKQVELARRKYKKELDARIMEQKMTQYLIRRGFSTDQIRLVLATSAA